MVYKNIPTLLTFQSFTIFGSMHLRTGRFASDMWRSMDDIA